MSDTNSIKETFKVFNLYGKASGAKLNKTKSEILVLGRGKISKTELKDLEIKECDEIVQLLCIWIGKNKKACELLNWENKVNTITKILNFWKMRNVSLHGKVSVITSLLMSKIWYTFMLVNIPEKYYSLIKDICLKYLWNDKPYLISYKVIINKYQKVGLNFPEIFQTKLAFRMNFLLRLLDKSYVAFWKSTCLYFFFQSRGNDNDNIFQAVMAEWLRRCT